MGLKLAGAAVALALAAAACGSDSDDDAGGATTTEATADPTTTTTEAMTTTTEAAVAPGASTLELASSEFGDILVDADGRTLYFFVPDAQSGESTCYDQCEANWPVFEEATGVGAGVDASLLGTTSRTTGDVQATYNGWPLYYFAADAAPGDTNGQGVGGVWYVANSSGHMVGDEIRLASSDLGDILTDVAGRTLYLFLTDAQSGDSSCYDQCEANWPVLAEAAAVGEGLDSSLLGTTTRTNGDVQATYNGWPLYYFAADSVVGDTNGQGVGDVWYVLDAAGDAVGLPG